MLSLVVLLALWHVASAQTKTTSGENTPYYPIPSYQGLVVAGEHLNGNYTDGSAYVGAYGLIAKVDSILNDSDPYYFDELVDCSRLCSYTTACDVFMYCEPGDGPCPVGRFPTLPEKGCYLIQQAEASPETTYPMLVSDEKTVAKLFSGAPIQIAEIQKIAPVSGFTELFAQSFYNKYDYNCTDTLLDGACALRGSPQALAPICENDPEGRCSIMVWYPAGRPDLGSNVTFFKGGEGILVDPGAANLNAKANSYVRISKLNETAALDDDDNGLSSGAVAGIAVGCAIGGAAIAATLLLCLRSRKLGVHASSSKSGSVLLDPNNATVAGYASTHTTPPASGGTNTTRGSSPGPAALPTIPMPIATVVNPRKPVPSPFSTPGGDIELGTSEINTPFAFPLSSTLDGTSSSGDAAPKSQYQPFDGISIMERGESGHVRAVKSIDKGNRSSGEGASTAEVLEGIKAADWKHYSVDFNSIEWLKHPNGSRWELGHGAFSKVYKVTLNGALVVAAKVIPLEDPNSERVFLREAITLFHLRHANIVQFSGVCIHNREGILLMELMEGGSLYSVMQLQDNSGRRIVGWYQEGKRIMLGIAQALYYLHNLELIHMDLKSANVLLTRDFTPKLADVGFTRVWQTMELSAKDSRIGTFAYMAPEILLGGSITAASDIYSFGVMLRELCTAEFASRGRNRAPKVPEECPKAVEDILLKCLKNDPKERPTAKELYFMLQNAAA